MKVSNLQYIHFFISEKEYLLSVSSVLTVEETPDTFTICLKKENDKSVEDLSSFFQSMSGKEILIFVGYYNKQKYENDVMSAATNFTKATTSPGSLILEFLKIESSK